MSGEGAGRGQLLERCPVRGCPGRGPTLHILALALKTSAVSTFTSQQHADSSSSSRMQATLRLLLLLAVLGLAMAVPLQDSQQPQENQVGKDEESILDKLNSRCSKREASACLMLKLVTYVNRLLKKADIPLGDGVEISQTRVVAEESIVGDESGRGLETEEEQIGNLIASKMWAFVKSRALRWEVLPGSEVVLSTTPASDGQLSLDLSLRDTSGKRSLLSVDHCLHSINSFKQNTNLKNDIIQ